MCFDLTLPANVGIPLHIGEGLVTVLSDVSFLIDNTLNLYEQQATFNPNMPMRFLIYAGMLYAKFVEQNRDYHRYSSSQQHAPTPKCVCFYNGQADKDDKSILKLSDAFVGKIEPDIELYVTMININYGHNMELLNACKPLSEYALFVDKVCKGQHFYGSLAEAVEAALDELPDNAVIKPFLLANKAEITNMCITEYDEVKTMAEERLEGLREGRLDGIREGLKEGRKEGERIGLINALVGLVRDGLLSPETAAARAGMSLSEFEQKIKSFSQ